ncbi:MAG: VOC family protein [Gemmatimonadota bacterium]
MSASRMLFANLAVKDLAKTKAFFAALGFEFNAQFTDDNAACMVVNDKALVMLLTEPFFQSFTSREICDTRTHSEGLFGVSCESRAEVDDLMGKAIAAGAADADKVQDHGFMYGRAFHDLDGHHWEVMWMDPASVQ